MMQISEAASALGALANVHRLAVFRLLVEAGHEGMAAGAIAREVGALPNSLSSHLAILSQARLIRSHRSGRSIIYSADYDGMRRLLGFLVADCCGGRPEFCAPLGDVVERCGPNP